MRSWMIGCRFLGGCTVQCGGDVGFIRGMTRGLTFDD